MILLTGVTGKIGGETAKQLVEQGASLRALVRDEAKAADLQAACQTVLDRHKLPALAIGRGSLWQIAFMGKEPESFADFIQADMASTRELDIQQMKNGLYVLPGVRRFVSAVHTDKDFDDTVEALDAACRAMR